MKRVFALWAGLGAASAMGTGAAIAQEADIGDGPYLRVGAGAAFASDWEQDFAYNPEQAFPAVPLPEGQAVSNGGGLTAAVALGFNYTEGIRTELEYRYAITEIEGVAPADRPGLGAPADDDVKAHFVMSNFYFDLNNETRLTPFIGGGVGGAFVTNENGDRDAALAYQGRAGVSYDFGAGFSADLEYIYLRTNDLVYGPLDEEFTADSASMRIDGDHYASSSVMFSFRRQF